MTHTLSHWTDSLELWVTPGEGDGERVCVGINEGVLKINCPPHPGSEEVCGGDGLLKY